MGMKAAHDDASVLLVIGPVLASIFLHLDPAPELLIVLPPAHGCVERTVAIGHG
jgi:hypothetical protein